MRRQSFGQTRALTPVDRFGVWLSARQQRRFVSTYRGLRVGDFGCGYHATFVQSVLDELGSAVLVDVAIAPELHEHPKVTAIEGTLPGAMSRVADRSLDVALCISVLEHLVDPAAALAELRRVVAQGGVCLINVPSWRGKRLLEFSAFRLGTSGVEEIDDHKRYYDPRDLWPMLVAAGFRPRSIRCFKHKFGLNTFAVCRADSP
jgi:SAM-dependent methyltransferase